MTPTPEKITLASMLVSLAMWIDWLIIPLFILLATMIIDYITGIRAAKHRGEMFDNSKGAKGIEKKVMLLLLVGVGLLLDMLLLYCSGAFGFELPIKFAVAVLIAVWLTVHEIQSILNNIKDTGANIPVWLLPLVKNLKSKVDVVAPQVEDKTEDTDKL